MKTIYLVRHSVPYKNISYENSSLDDYTQNILTPLSSEGEKNAKKIADKYFSNNINYLCSSEYSRAINTAKYIAETNNIAINIFSNFNERKLGNTKNIKEDFWLKQLKNENIKTKNGESQQEVRNRMLKGIKIVLNSIIDNESAVIISHATAITFLLMNWCELIDFSLEGKKRHLKYKNKTIINDSFKTPEIFKLTFTSKNKIIEITRI